MKKTYRIKAYFVEESTERYCFEVRAKSKEKAIEKIIEGKAEHQWSKHMSVDNSFPVCMDEWDVEVIEDEA